MIFYLRLRNGIFRCRNNFIVILYSKLFHISPPETLGVLCERREEREVAASKNIKGPPPGHLGYFAEEKTFIV